MSGLSRFRNATRRWQRPLGQLSAESICGCFINTSRQASCNYGIGFDGRVSLCVEEKNRSWCSSSRENDQRAITIECASDKTAPYAKYAQSAPTPAPAGTLYRVQVGAYSHRENADRQLAAVQGKGFDALIKKIGNLYKVQTGAYSVKANADAQLARVKAAGFNDAYITTESGGTVVATSPEEKPAYTTYVVQDGDSLWKIAEKLLGNGNEWPKIAELNGIKDTIIYAGQKLKIPE